MLKESFIAPTPDEAYKLAIKKYGSIDNFKVVNAKQYKDKDGELVAEITIEVDENSFANSLGISEEEALIEEINILKDKMQRMKEALNPVKKEPTTAIEEVKKILTNRGLKKSWVESMLDPFIGTQVAEDKSLLISFILEELEEGLNIAKDPIGSKFLLLVGPTGVGKTTTLAKIASWAILKGMNPQKMALVNLDNFRVGAHEQLEFYSKALDIAYFTPKDKEQLEATAKVLKGMDLVLIDSAGSSPYDAQKILSTVEFCKVIDKDFNDMSATLVISATSKYSDLMQIYKHFSFLNLDKVIITKVDETKNIGNVIAFLLETKLPISFLSTGQEVPKDFELATKRRLIEIFIGEVDA